MFISCCIAYYCMLIEERFNPNCISLTQDVTFRYQFLHIHLISCIHYSTNIILLIKSKVINIFLIEDEYLVFINSIEIIKTIR